MLTNVIFIGLMASFIVLFLGTSGARDYLVARSPKLLSEMFDCTFCLSFWICVLLSILFYIFVSREGPVMVYPLLAAPIARIMI